MGRQRNDDIDYRTSRESYSYEFRPEIKRTFMVPEGQQAKLYKEYKTETQKIYSVLARPLNFDKGTREFVESDKLERIWFPRETRFGFDDPTTDPEPYEVSEGDVYECVFNRASHRWEVIQTSFKEHMIQVYPEVDIDPAGKVNDVLTPNIASVRRYLFDNDAVSFSPDPDVENRVDVLNMQGFLLRAGVAYTAQRYKLTDRWIITGPFQYELTGVAVSVITAGSKTGTVRVKVDGADKELLQNVWHNWMDGAENISNGKEVIIRWFEDLWAWRVVGAECE